MFVLEEADTSIWNMLFQDQNEFALRIQYPRKTKPSDLDDWMLIFLPFLLPFLSTRKTEILHLWIIGILRYYYIIIVHIVLILRIVIFLEIGTIYLRFFIWIMLIYLRVIIIIFFPDSFGWRDGRELQTYHDYYHLSDNVNSYDFIRAAKARGNK